LPKFAKLNPCEIFGKPLYAKINTREMQIFELAKILNHRENLYT